MISGDSGGIGGCLAHRLMMRPFFFFPIILVAACGGGGWQGAGRVATRQTKVRGPRRWVGCDAEATEGKGMGPAGSACPWQTLRTPPSTGSGSCLAC